MAITAVTDLLKRKREVLFAEGHFVDGVDDLTIGTDTTDETIHVHGTASAIAGSSVDNGNISITVLRENAAGQNLIQVITDNDPLVTDNNAKYINWDNTTERNLWVNIMNEDQSRYIGAIFIPKFVAAVTGPAGAPNDRGRRTFTGRSEIPQEYTGDGLSICAELLSQANDSSLRNHTLSGGTVPVAVPSKTSIYAIGIRAINSGAPGGPGSNEPNWTTEMLGLDKMTAAMVASNGDVDWTAISAASSLSTVNYAMIYFLTSGTGVYPDSGGGVDIDLVPDRLTTQNDPLR